MISASWGADDQGTDAAKQGQARRGKTKEEERRGERILKWGSAKAR